MKLGKCDFSLAFILLLSMQSSSRELGNLSVGRLPNPSSLISLAREFAGWIIWGRSGEESSVFFSNSIDLAVVLIRHGQYNATEVCCFLFSTTLMCSDFWQNSPDTSCFSS